MDDEQQNDIEQETQHEKKQAASKSEEVTPEDPESGIEQETQHEKKAAATKPAKESEKEERE